MNKTKLMAAWLALQLCAVVGCASIDHNYPREESHTIYDTEATWLGQRYSNFVPQIPDGQSAFHPLINGMDALSARLLLASKAEKTIDTQYYLVKTDHTSLAFIDALLQAADRGVRVRLLLDDIYSSGYDVGVAALNSHENFEIRIFNPFNRGWFGKAWSGMTNLSRINRRMHTKSFTVDSQATIVGGRNIADEYFGARKDAKFGDTDVVGVGPIVHGVSNMFDTFWNHTTALPVPAFAKMPDDPGAELLRLREHIAESRNEIAGSKYADAVTRTSAHFLEEDSKAFELAPYKLIYDTPDKGIKTKEGPEKEIFKDISQSLQMAKERVVILSPYFVPMKSGVELFSELEARGVDVTVVTNSLAANNHSAVHGGYIPARKPLLRAGVELYEVRPDADVAGADLVAASGAKTTMHTKTYLIDNDKVFIGSFNFDPRSAHLNTESGVLIQSEHYASLFEQFIERGKQDQAYRVELNQNGHIRWKTTINGKEKVYKKEPESSWFQRFSAGLTRILPVRSQL